MENVESLSKRLEGWLQEVDHMLDAKISSISFSASKTFLVNYLLDDSSDGTMELLKGEQLKHI